MTKFTDLLDGYRRFRDNDWQAQRDRWDELKDGQSPKVMIISCSDSRVDPTQIFDSNPGETFVVRNVAALVPPYETSPGQHGVSAALEFAVQFLKVEEIVVMGHGSCGGCAAALSEQMKGASAGDGGFVAQWITLLDDARNTVVGKHSDTSSGEAQLAMEHEGVRTSLANLATFPFIRDKLDNGAIKTIGAWFGIAEGKLHVLDQSSGDFSIIE